MLNGAEVASLFPSHTRSLPSSRPLLHSHPNPKSLTTLIPTGTPQDPTTKYGQDEHTASSQAEKQGVSNQCSDSLNTDTCCDGEPQFEMNRPGAPTRYQRPTWTMLSKPMLREAYEKEGLRVDWALVKRIATEGDGDGDDRNRLAGQGWRRGVRSKL